MCADIKHLSTRASFKPEASLRSRLEGRYGLERGSPPTPQRKIVLASLKTCIGHRMRERRIWECWVGVPPLCAPLHWVKTRGYLLDKQGDRCSKGVGGDVPPGDREQCMI